MMRGALATDVRGNRMLLIAPVAHAVAQRARARIGAVEPEQPADADQGEAEAELDPG